MEVSSVLQEGEGLMGCSLASQGAKQNLSSEDLIQQVLIRLIWGREVMCFRTFVLMEQHANIVADGHHRLEAPSLTRRTFWFL